MLIGEFGGKFDGLRKNDSAFSISLAFITLIVLTGVGKGRFIVV